jgi:hypothetical protein
MHATCLKANPDKTRFILFGSTVTKELPIQVGEVMVNESTEAEFLGITFNKKLNWKSHMSQLESELKKRIGILKRLTWHLPKDTVVTMVEPIFMAKLRYGKNFW